MIPCQGGIGIKIPMRSLIILIMKDSGYNRFLYSHLPPPLPFFSLLSVLCNWITSSFFSPPPLSFTSLLSHLLPLHLPFLFSPFPVSPYSFNLAVSSECALLFVQVYMHQSGRARKIIARRFFITGRFVSFHFVSFPSGLFRSDLCLSLFTFDLMT